MNQHDIDFVFDESAYLSFTVVGEENIDREKALVKKAFQLDDKDNICAWFDAKIPSLALQRYTAVVNFFQDEDDYWDLFLDYDELKDELQSFSELSHDRLIQLQLLLMLERCTVDSEPFVNISGHELTVGCTYFRCKPVSELPPAALSVFNFIVEYMWTKRSNKKATKVLFEPDVAAKLEDCDSQALVAVCHSVYNIERKYIYLLLNMMTTWNVVDRARCLSDKWLDANPTYKVGSSRKRELSDIMFKHEVATALF
jgi:hypothetical protein